MKNKIENVSSISLSFCSKSYQLTKCLREKTATKMQGFDPFQILDGLSRLYGNDTSKLDVFPAGLLEFRPTGPGPLFRDVILDQFTRVRDGDRFWFENRDNK